MLSSQRLLQHLGMSQDRRQEQRQAYNPCQGRRQESVLAAGPHYQCEVMSTPTAATPGSGCCVPLGKLPFSSYNFQKRSLGNL